MVTWNYSHVDKAFNLQVCVFLCEQTQLWRLRMAIGRTSSKSGVYVSGRSSIEFIIVIILSLNSVWRNPRKRMSPGTRKMFICNNQRYRMNALFSFQLNSAEMNLVESCLFCIKSPLLIFWLPLAWLLSTKGMQLDGDAEQNHSFLSPRWGRMASARAFLGLWPFPSLLFSTHVLLFFFYVPCVFHGMPCFLICMINFIPVFMPLLRWTDSFQGLAHFSYGDSRNEMVSFLGRVHSFVTLFSRKVGLPTVPTPRLQITE